MKNKIIDVYFIIGQSNAVGFGMDTADLVLKSDKRYSDGFNNVLYYGSQERWDGSSLDEKFKPVRLGMGVSPEHSGAEIGIAPAVNDNGRMSAIIKCAWGAVHIYPDTQYEISLEQGTFTPPTYIKRHRVDLSANRLIGNMYNRFVKTVKNGLSLLIKDGYTPIIRGVWWMQGEAEMFTHEMSSAYKELYKTLILDVREMLGCAVGYDCSDIPFVCGLPKWNTDNSPAPEFQETVRAAMVDVAGELVNVGYVDCMPLTQHDDWHFDAAGQRYLGDRFIAFIRKIKMANAGE